MTLNGFPASFNVTGIIFFLSSPVTRPAAPEKKGLALFFHPSLDKKPDTGDSLKTEERSASDVEIFFPSWYHVACKDVRRN